MKLTKTQLKQIIKEEIASSLTESDYEEERMPDDEIFRRLAADLRALDPYNYPDLNLDQVVDLLNRQKDFKGAWEDAQQAEVDEEERIEL